MIFIKKLVLLLIIVFILVLIPSVIAPVWFGSGTDSGLVLHIPCEGDFRDISGNGNDGTQSGGVSITRGVKGRACEFDGTTKYIDVPTTGYSENTSSLSFWFKANTLPGTTGIIEISGSSLSPGPNIAVVSNNNCVRVYRYNAFSTCIPINLNEWYHFSYVSKNQTHYDIYINGALNTSAVSSYKIRIFSHLYVGSGYNKYFNGSIDEVRIYNRSLSATEISALYDSGKTYHLSIKTTPTQGLIDETGLVGYWKFNSEDGSDSTTAVDSSGQGNDGTVTGATFTNEGRFKEGYSFDGVGDKITINKASMLEGLSSATVSVWVKLKGQGGQGIVGQYSASSNYHQGFGVLDGSGYITCVFGNGTNVQQRLQSPSNVLLSGQWTHVVCNLNSTDRIMYINGIPITNNSFSGTISPSSWSTVDIGGRGDTWSGQYFNGSIDEVRIYNRSLSATEVANLYNGTKSNYISIKTTPELGLLNDTPLPEISDNTGLVGWWKLDDLINGNTTDSSGQGNNGSVIGATYTSDARWDGGYSFDGSNDYVTLGDEDSWSWLSDTASFSLWFYFNGHSGYNDTLLSNYITNGSGEFGFDFLTGPNSKLYINFRKGASDTRIVSNTIFSNNTWYHIVVTHNSTNASLYVNSILDKTVTNSLGNITASSRLLEIGRRINQYYMYGTIDEVRIYNRSLSAEEIKELYLSKGLVGHWKMDAGTGSNSTTAIDSSGYGNTGTVTGATFTNEGRFKEAYEFDGLTSGIDMASASQLNLTGNLTISAWIKPNNYIAGSADAIVHKGLSYSSGGLGLLFSSSNRFIYSYSNTYVSFNTAPTVNYGNWQHVVLTANETNASIYINGILRETKTAGNPSANSYIFSIGRRVSSNVYHFNGSIDEVRIYNRALTSTEISGLYNGSKSSKLVMRSVPG